LGDKRHTQDGTAKVLDMERLGKAQEMGIISKKIFETVQEIFGTNTSKLELNEWLQF